MATSEAAEYLRLATADLDAATVLLAPGHWHISCFLAQQAAETALKAVLLARKQHFPKTHDLEALVELIRSTDAAFPDFAESSAVLNEYSVAPRYDPTAAWEINRGEASEAIRLAGAVLARCKHVIDAGP